MASKEPPAPTRRSPPRYKLDPQAPLDDLEPLRAVLQHLSALCRANI
jgi:hypothetical protein